MFWQIGNNNVNFTTCFDTLANIMSILRRVLTYLQNKCQFYDVFLMVRTLKYGTVARFFRKCTKNVDETRPEPSGTLRAKYGIYWWKKHQFYDVFLHNVIYEKRRQFYDAFWHIGKNLVNFTTCFDTCSKKNVNCTTCFWGSERWSTVLLHDFFEKLWKT